MTTPDDKLHRELGELDTRLAALEEASDKQNDKLDELVAWKNGVDGGKRAIGLIIAAGALVGGLISWVMTNLAWKG